MWSDVKKELFDSYKYRYVIYNFVSCTLKIRYRKTFLGFIWSVLGPMLHYLVVGVVFAYTMKGSIDNYAAFMFSGALLYNLFSGTTHRSPNVFLSNEHYIKKIYIPKLIFVLDTVLVELVNFILAFIALFLLAVLLGRISFSQHLILVPFSILLVVFFSIGCASIFSVAGVYFRDLIHIIPVFLQAIFFLTPILYVPSQLPEKFRFLIKLNPLYYYIEIFRRPLVFNEWPPLEFILFCVLLSLLSVFIGLLILKKYDNKIVFRL